MLAEAAIIQGVNSKQRKTLEAIFAKPTDGALEWSRIEALLMAVGCRRIEGRGSSVTFEKGGIKAHFHRPHPQRESLKYRVDAARDFLTRIGATP